MAKRTAKHASDKGSATVRKPQPRDPASRHQAAEVSPGDALARAQALPVPELPAGDILALQRAAGNRAVGQLLAGRVQLASRGGLTIQTNLAVGPPDDQFEREADRIAHQVISSPATPTTSIQRDIDDKEQVQMKPLASTITPVPARSAAGGIAPVETGIEATIAKSRGGGEPLPDQFRARMERSFGADFGPVRVHTDGNADSLNRSLHSRAFTTGHDLFFKRGEYDSGSSEGQRLIAHELAHVIQQNRPNAVGVTEPNRREKTQLTNSSGSGNHSIQRNGPTATPAPPPREKPDWETNPKAEDKFLKEVEARLEIKPRAKKLVSKLVESWKNIWEWLKGNLSIGYSFWKAREAEYSAARQRVLDASAELSGLDVIGDALDAKHTALRQQLVDHNKINNNVDQSLIGGKIGWLLSYSPEDKKKDTKDQHDVIKPVVAREQRELNKLVEAKTKLDEITLPQERKKGERITVAREIVQADNATKAVTPLEDGEKEAFETAKVFFANIETTVKTTIETMIGTAMAKGQDYLDITEEQKTKTREKWEETKLFKSPAEAQLKAAAKIQHEPPRDAWFTKLGLVNKEAKYNWLEAGSIGGDRVHETLHHTTVTVGDIVKPTLDDLKNQILGAGFLAYHVSLETTTIGKKNSHSYRGGREITRYVAYRDKHGQTALSRVDLRAALGAKRDTCVNRVEASVKDAQDNKGRGMTTTEVVKKLEIG